ncbi:hypothetical protein TSAR_015655, partial [Trichomalopsis sarcophagae]
IGRVYICRAKTKSKEIFPSLTHNIPELRRGQLRNVCQAYVPTIYRGKARLLERTKRR